MDIYIETVRTSLRKGLALFKYAAFDKGVVCVHTPLLYPDEYC